MLHRIRSIGQRTIGGIAVLAKTRCALGHESKRINTSLRTESTTHRAKILEELQKDTNDDIVGSCPFDPAIFEVGNFGLDTTEILFPGGNMYYR